MPASIVNLDPETRAPADWLEYHPIDWVAIHTATPGALSAGPAALTGAQHYLCYFSVTFSAAPAIGIIQVKDGNTVIWQEDFSASAPFAIFRNFGKRPLRGSIGAALTVNVATAGGSIVQTCNAAGYTVAQGTQTSV